MAKRVFTVVKNIDYLLHYEIRYKTAQDEILQLNKSCF